MGYQPKHKGAKCRVTTEWGGTFIGRKRCSTHDTRWDTGQVCPKQEIPSDKDGLGSPAHKAGAFSDA